MLQDRHSGTGRAPNLMRFGMIACCAVMLLPIAAIFLAGGGTGGPLASAGLLAPLLICLGVHFAMHRKTGRSCHGHDGGNGADSAGTGPDQAGTGAMGPATERAAG